MVNELHAQLRRMQAGAPAPSPLDRPIRRERTVNWGDRTRLQGGDRQTLAWVSLEACQPLLVYAAATVRGSDSTICVVTLEWGHGGASIEADYPIVKRLRVPLAASMVKVSGRLVDESTGRAPEEGVVADISAFVSPGLDGETLRNTRWLSQTSHEGVFAEGPERLMTVEAFNGVGSGVTFLQLFDGHPVLGGTPALVLPVPAYRRARVHRLDSQPFARSLHWAASSAPLSYTPDPAAQVRVDVELLL